MEHWRNWISSGLIFVRRTPSSIYSTTGEAHTISFVRSATFSHKIFQFYLRLAYIRVLYLEELTSNPRSIVRTPSMSVATIQITSHVPANPGVMTWWWGRCAGGRTRQTLRREMCSAFNFGLVIWREERGLKSNQQGGLCPDSSYHRVISASGCFKTSVRQADVRHEALALHASTYFGFRELKFGRARNIINKITCAKYLVNDLTTRDIQS